MLSFTDAVLNGDIHKTPTIVYIQGKAVTKVIANSAAKTLADMFVKSGYCSQSDIRLKIPDMPSNFTF